mgnify:FL=1
MHVYDPVAEEPVKKLFPTLNYAESAQDAIDNAEIVLLLTEWQEFTQLNYGDKLVIDGKNIFDSERVNLRPKNYEGVCW